MSKRAKRKPEPEHITETGDTANAEHFTETAKRHSNTITTVEPEPEPADEPDTPPDSPPTGNNDDTPAAGRQITVFTGQNEYQSPPPSDVQVLSQKVESMQRTIDNLIQIVEANGRVQPVAGNGTGGWQESLNQGLGLVRQLLSPEQASTESQLTGRLLDMTLRHYETLDRVVSSVYNVPPPTAPVQHMTLRQ